MTPPAPAPRPARRRRDQLASRLHLRRLWRTAVIVGVAILGGLAAAGFARLCDEAMRAHERLYALARWPTLLLLPAGFAAAAWLTRRFAPEAAGSGIPQVIAAAEQRWRGRWGGQRVTLKTAAWKVALTGLMLVCGASVGREGPTVQVVAGIIRTLTRGLKGGPGRRAIIIAGGAAGVSAAFNTPIAGVVFDPRIPTISRGLFTVVRLSPRGIDFSGAAFRKRNREIASDIDLADTPKFYTELLRLKLHARSMDAMVFASGKDYILPLIWQRLRISAGYRGDIDQLKARLASLFDPRCDVWLARKLAAI